MPAYHKRGENTAASISSFAGFPRSNTTQVPDVFFDEIMPFLNLAETRVMLYIIRRTIGFKKDWDGISIDQLINGILRQDGSRFDWGTQLTEKTVKLALRSLVEKGLLIVDQQFDPNGRQRENLYSLKWQDTGGVKTTPLPRVATTPLPPPNNYPPPPCSNYPPQDTELTRDSRTRDSSLGFTEPKSLASSSTQQKNSQTPAYPPKVDDPTESDFPATSQWIRSRWPDIDDDFIRRILGIGYWTYKDISGEPLKDIELLAVVKKATKKRQESPALYLHTIPQVVRSWS